MAYDSIKKKVEDYSQKKTDIDEEDLDLSKDEAQVDAIIGGVLHLDADLQEQVNAIRREYNEERNRIESVKTELESEKKDISDTISNEIVKLSDAGGKLSKIENNKYGKEAEKARKKSEEYISQLKEMLGEIDDNNSSYGSSMDSQSLNSYPDMNNTEATVDNTSNLNLYGLADNNALYGNGQFVPLLNTGQSMQSIFLEDGHFVDMYDHPLAPNSYRICNQGSAYPTGPQGTCGCCACGTIINKAGGKTDEHDVVEYAWNNHLCSDSGGTSPESWVGILAGAGINSHSINKCSLEELAEYVEEGRGVIIGVSACTYRREMYGRYFPGKADGHALVLESVIRDHETGEILEYIVSDSNGTSRDDACYRVPAKVLKRAYRRKRKPSIVTDDVIW